MLPLYDVRPRRAAPTGAMLVEMVACLHLCTIHRVYARVSKPRRQHTHVRTDATRTRAQAHTRSRARARVDETSRATLGMEARPYPPARTERSGLLGATGLRERPRAERTSNTAAFSKEMCL